MRFPSDFSVFSADYGLLHRRAFLGASLAASAVAATGAGRIRRVEISTDGGTSWVNAELDGPVLPRMLTRFRLPWQWSGGPALLLSRATDETGAVQPSRAEWYVPWAPGQLYHQNAIQVWSVSATGEVKNVYL